MNQNVEFQFEMQIANLKCKIRKTTSSKYKSQEILRVQLSRNDKTA